MSRNNPTAPITSLLWWMTPQEALAHPQRLLQQTMAIGLPTHVEQARQRWSPEDFAAALLEAPPGLFDIRSWCYWHTVLGIAPLPPLPRRQLLSQ